MTRLHGVSVEALRRQAADAGRIVSAAHGRVASIAARMRWILVASIAITFVLAYGLPTLLGQVLGTGMP